jgi:5-bromo-4-chloroindolyl phosphate hydrolysis protein
MAWRKLDGQWVGGPQNNQMGSAPNPQRPQPQKKSTWILLPLLITVVIAIILAFVFNPFNFYSSIFSGVILLVSFCCLCKAFAPPKAPKVKKEKEKKVERPEVNLDEKPLTEVEKIINEGRLYLEAIRKANDKISKNNPQAYEQIKRMETCAEKIFDYISEHPEDAPQIRKFMDYYLPTLLKLLNSYNTLKEQGITGAHIDTTMTDIEGIFHTMAVAFEKQLDNLFEDDALDISADITVLKNMMAQEGILDSEETLKNPGDIASHLK